MATPIKILAKRLGITVTEYKHRVKRDKLKAEYSTGDRPMLFRPQAKKALQQWVKDFKSIKSKMPLDPESEDCLAICTLAVKDELAGIMSVSGLASLAMGHIRDTYNPELVSEAKTILADLRREYNIDGSAGFLQVTLKA